MIKSSEKYDENFIMKYFNPFTLSSAANRSDVMDADWMALISRIKGHISIKAPYSLLISRFT